MDYQMAGLGPVEMALAFAVALVAGVVKGLVGFAMPMLLISGLSTFLPAELALAGLILPTMVTNTMQALPQGPRAAWGSILRFRTFLIVGGLVLAVSAQLVRILPPHAMFLVIGVPISLFALLQLAGKPIVINNPTKMKEALVAGIAGFLGGMSGVWGPPTVAYLTALNTEKAEQMRVQGVIYGLGSVALLVAHLGSGILNAKTIVFSMAGVVPAVLGMLVGQKLHERVDQVTFRRATLLVLAIAGLNLVRRGIFS